MAKRPVLNALAPCAHQMRRPSLHSASASHSCDELPGARRRHSAAGGSESSHLLKLLSSTKARKPRDGKVWVPINCGHYKTNAKNLAGGTHAGTSFFFFFLNSSELSRSSWHHSCVFFLMGVSFLVPRMKTAAGAWSTPGETLPCLFSRAHEQSRAPQLLCELGAKL